VVSLSK